MLYEVGLHFFYYQHRATWLGEVGAKGIYLWRREISKWGEGDSVIVSVRGDGYFYS